MKVSCIRVSTDLLIGKKHDTIISFLAKNFLGIGVVLNNLITTQNNPENIFNALKFSDTEIVFIIGESTSGKNNNIKKTLSKYLNLQLVKNIECVQAVTNYYKDHNSPILAESENEYYLPQGAVPLSSKYSHLQGFIINGNTTYIFLPDDLNVVKDIYEQSLKNILQENNQIKYKTLIVKTFGIHEKDIYSILSDLVKNIYKILFITYPSDLEVTLLIRYNEALDSELVRSFTAKVFERLNKYIYADEDVTMAMRVQDLLNISNKTLAVAEAVTGGNIASTLTKECNNVNGFLTNAVVCSNAESKIKLLGVNRSILERYGEVSIETVYEMAAALLEVSGANYVVCTSGIHETKNENDKKTTFIAVGDIDGIHVYKNTFIGNKENVIENITQTSLYYLIKNIKQNDLFLNHTTI